MSSENGQSPRSADMDNKENNVTLPYFTPLSAINLSPRKTTFQTPAQDITVNTTVIQHSTEHELTVVKVHDLHPEVSHDDDNNFNNIPDKFIFKGQLGLFVSPASTTNAMVMSTPLVTVACDGLGNDAMKKGTSFLSKLNGVDLLVLSSVTENNCAHLPILIQESNSGLFFSKSILGLGDTLVALAHQSKVHHSSWNAAFPDIKIASQIGVGSLDLISICKPIEDQMDGAAFILVWSPADGSGPIRRVFFTSNCSEGRIVDGVEVFVERKSRFGPWFAQLAMTENTARNSKIKLSLQQLPEKMSVPEKSRLKTSPVIPPKSLPQIKPTLDKNVAAGHHFQLTRQRSVLPNSRPTHPIPPAVIKPVSIRGQRMACSKSEQPKSQESGSGDGSLGKNPGRSLVGKPLVATVKINKGGHLKPVSGGNDNDNKSADKMPKVPVFLWVDVAFVPHHAGEYLVSESFFATLRAGTYIFGHAEISAEKALRFMVQSQTTGDGISVIVFGPTIIPADLTEQLAKNHVTVNWIAAEATMKIEGCTDNIPGVQILFD